MFKYEKLKNSNNISNLKAYEWIKEYSTFNEYSNQILEFAKINQRKMNMTNLNLNIDKRLKKMQTVITQKNNSIEIDTDFNKRKISCKLKNSKYFDENENENENHLFSFSQINKDKDKEKEKDKDKDDKIYKRKITKKNTYVNKNKNTSVDIDAENSRNKHMKLTSSYDGSKNINNSNNNNFNENDKINNISNLNLDNINCNNNSIIKSENQKNNKNNSNTNNIHGLGKSYLQKKNEGVKRQNQYNNKYVPFNNRNKENISKTTFRKSSDFEQNKIINKAEKKLNEINSYTNKTKFAQQNLITNQQQQNDSSLNDQLKNKANISKKVSFKTPTKNTSTNIKGGQCGYEIMFNKNNYFNNSQNLKSINQKKQVRNIRRQSKSFNENDFRYLGLEENQNNYNNNNDNDNDISFKPHQMSLTKDKQNNYNKDNNGNNLYNKNEETSHSNSCTQSLKEKAMMDINSNNSIRNKNLFSEINNNNNNNYSVNVNFQNKDRINSQILNKSNNNNNNTNTDTINNYPNSLNLNLNINVNSNMDLIKADNSKKFSENSFEKEKKIYFNEDSKNIMEKIYYIKSRKCEFDNNDNINENSSKSIFQNLIEFSNDNLNSSDLKEIQKILFGDIDMIKNNFHFKSVMKLLKKKIDIIIKCTDFDIFNFVDFVGQENSLPILSIVLFDHLNFFKFFNKKYFENFIYEISRGYIKENYYHNDIHAADVLHTSFTYLTIGRVKEVIKAT
jgi:hypothetical protein